MTPEPTTAQKMTRLIEAMLQGGWRPPKMKDILFTFDRRKIDVELREGERPGMWCIHLECASSRPVSCYNVQGKDFAR